MAAVSTIIAGAALASAAYGGYSSHVQNRKAGDAADRAAAEQARARAQMESDMMNQQTSASMRLMRQRVLQGRMAGMGRNPMGGALGVAGGSPASVQKTALGA